MPSPKKLSIPPHLDITSDSFDPKRALKCESIHLPFPNVKTFNNIAEYYSRTFLKKQLDESQKSQDTLMKRNYHWYYQTIGRHLPSRGHTVIERNKFTRRKILIDCTVSKPLRSRKVVHLKSDYSFYWKRKCISWKRLNDHRVATSKDFDALKYIKEYQKLKISAENVQSAASQGSANLELSPLKHDSSSDEDSLPFNFWPKPKHCRKLFGDKFRQSTHPYNKLGVKSRPSHGFYQQKKLSMLRNRAINKFSPNKFSPNKALALKSPHKQALRSEGSVSTDARPHSSGFKNSSGAKHNIKTGNKPILDQNVCLNNVSGQLSADCDCSVCSKAKNKVNNFKIPKKTA